MKNIFTLVCLLLSIFCITTFAKAEPIVMYVATDPHYISPSLHDNGEVFMEIINRSDGKVVHYIEEITEAFIDETIQAHPDLLLLTGDLTFKGGKNSHIDLAKKLYRIEEAGIEVLVIPGNHDLYGDRPARFFGKEYEEAEAVDSVGFEEIYRDFGYATALSVDKNSLSYSHMIGEEWMLLLVDVNTEFSMNTVKEETLVWVEEQLKFAKEKGYHIIGASHQNIANQSSLLTKGFTMDNATTLQSLYEEYNVLFNMSGHVHLQHITKITDTMVDIATSSLAVNPLQYGVVTLGEKEITYNTQKVDVDRWAEKMGKPNTNDMTFSEYAEWFFKEIAFYQALYSGIDDENPEELASYFADINAAYFAGEMDSVTIDKGLLKRWNNQVGFLPFYIDNIVTQEANTNHTHWSRTY